MVSNSGVERIDKYEIYRKLSTKQPNSPFYGQPVLTASCIVLPLELYHSFPRTRNPSFKASWNALTGSLSMLFDILIPGQELLKELGTQFFRAL